MNALWSYALAAVGVAGLLIATTRPRAGWWLNLAGQFAWLVYAINTRQWGFLISALVYGVAYARLLEKTRGRQITVDPYRRPA